MSGPAAGRRLSAGIPAQLHANPFQEAVMAVEVRIPTILRKHTGGEKAVTADGDVVAILPAVAGGGGGSGGLKPSPPEDRG